METQNLYHKLAEMTKRGCLRVCRSEIEAEFWEILELFK